MKNLKMFTILLFLINLTGVWGQAENTFPPKGFVGIGTKSPSAPLHVKTGIEDNLLRIEAEGNKRAGIILKNGIGYENYIYIDSFGWLSFDMESGHLMHIDKNGNVSIGSEYNQPKYKLDILGDIRLRGSAAQEYESPNAKIRFWSANTYETGYIGGNSNGIELGDMSSARIALGGGYIHLTTTAVNGNVGINTARPTGKLHIKAPDNGWSCGIRLEDDNTPNYYDIIYDSMFRIGYNNKTQFVIHQGNVGIGTTNGATGKLHIKAPHNGWSCGIRLEDDNTPNYYDIIYDDRFRIGYNSATLFCIDPNGAIRQRTNVIHPDYVFNSNYNLESIEEHATYMWEKKHLKAVPKVQLNQDGYAMIDMGEIQRGILEELEKAHIYISQLNDTKKDQAKIINQQQMQIDELTKRINQLESIIIGFQD